MKALILSIALLFVAGVGRAQEATFIANPSVAETALAASDIKNILLGTKANWGSGAIKLVIQTQGAVHEKVIQQYTQRTPDQFDKYWKKQVFTGKGSMPAVAKSDEEVVAFVTATPGAFGYIAKGSASDKTKVIEVK